MRLIFSAYILFLSTGLALAQSSGNHLISRLTPDGRLYFITPMEWQSEGYKLEMDITIHVHKDTDSVGVTCNLSLRDKQVKGLPDHVIMVGDTPLPAEEVTVLYMEKVRSKWHTRLQCKWHSRQLVLMLIDPTMSIQYDTTNLHYRPTAKALRIIQDAITIIAAENGWSL